MHSSAFKTYTSQFESINLNEINHLKLQKRVDDKFVLPISKINLLLDKIKNDYKILEINGERELKYHTTYFDTLQYDLYLNHHNRRFNRYKIRMRTYKVSNQSFLEIKRKNNKGQTIKSRMSIDRIGTLTKKHYNYIKSIIPLSEGNLEKSIENSFCRITLVSFKTLERITIDFDLNFLFNNNESPVSHISIIEIKKEKKTISSPINKALKEMNIYPTGFSKYCIGMTYIHPEIKQNSFKQNKLHIKKLENATLTNC